jgi:hypothetical protein
MKPESRVVVCFAAQIPLPPVQASNPGSGTRANWDQRVGQRSMPRVKGRIQDIRENTPQEASDSATESLLKPMDLVV